MRDPITIVHFDYGLASPGRVYNGMVAVGFRKVHSQEQYALGNMPAHYPVPALRDVCHIWPDRVIIGRIANTDAGQPGRAVTEPFVSGYYSKTWRKDDTVKAEWLADFYAATAEHAYMRARMARLKD